MIKKLLTLLLVGLSVVSFSFAYDSQCEGISPTQRFEIGLEEEIYNSNNNYFELKPKANLLYNGSQKVFHYGDNDNGMWFFWNNGKLYYIKTRNGGISDQGYFGYYVLTNYGNVCAGNSNNITNFYSNSDFVNPDGFNYFAGSYYLTPCFEYSDLNINVCFNHNSLTGSLGITTGDLNNLSSLYGYSDFGMPIENVEVPISNGLDGYDYVNITTGDTVLYFEDEVGLRKDMCYIGTKNLTGNYEDRLTYYQGSGYTIYDMYSNLFNTNSISIKQVGVFVNYWFRNYETRFMGMNRSSTGEALYNYVYEGPNNYRIDRGPGLTSPFRNNLGAYYFLASIRDDYSSYSDVDGEQLAYYCYMKFNSTPTNDGGNYNITDDHNSVYDNRVAVYARNQREVRQRQGSGDINSQSWVGTPLDYFTGDTYTDGGSFFSESFNRFAGMFQGLDISDLVLGNIPSYIVAFMLALILFRFLSH